MWARLSDELAATVEDVFVGSMRRKGHLVVVGSRRLLIAGQTSTKC